MLRILQRPDRWFDDDDDEGRIRKGRIGRKNGRKDGHTGDGRDYMEFALMSGTLPWLHDHGHHLVVALLQRREVEL